jgi:hypothetical protein
MTDDPEMWASILGWHCWRGVAGIWYARRTGDGPAAVIRAASLDALRIPVSGPASGGRGPA